MSISPLANALLCLNSLSDMVTMRVNGASSLRTAIEMIFEDHLESLSIDSIEGTLYASISFQSGSMTVVYEKGEKLQLSNIEYDGGRCEQFISIPVPEFLENLEVLSESDWYSDGNNGKPLDDAGKNLLNEMRRLGRSPEFRGIPSTNA